MTMVASVKTAPIAPNTTGIVSVSRVLLADAELEASAAWVALAVGPIFARSMFVK